MNLSRQPAGSGVPKLLAESRACLARNDHLQATQLLQRARGLDPHSDKVLLELGRVHALSYDFAAAERCFENAVHISPSKIDAVLTAGHHWMEIRNFEAATRYFEQALQYPPVRLVVFIRLSEMYGRLRRLEDAVAISERALHDYPAHEGALLARGKALRQMRRFEEAELILLQIVSNPSFPSEARAAAGYELGAVLDQRECYDEAFEAIMEAKALLRPNALSLMRTFRDKLGHMKQLRTGLTEKMMRDWEKVGQSDLQPARNIALLCGYPRSGTTLLEYVIDSHPGVVSADETSVFQNKAYFEISRNLSETTLYPSALSALSPRSLRQVRTEYFRGIESFLGQPVGNRLLLDKNPALTFDVPAMSRVFPESKFLVALRDPRDVCLSCFMQAWPVLPDTIPYLSPEGTIENYAAVMSLWLALKPFLGNRALEVRYEDLVEDLEGNARRTLGFLGLPWDEQVLRFNERAQTKVVRSPTYVEVGKPVYKTAMGRWKNYQKHFEPHFEKLAPFFNAFGYALIAFLCVIRNGGMLILFGTLMAFSLLRPGTNERDGAPRRASHAARRASFSLHGGLARRAGARELQT